jgi:hypothetical protein
LLNSPIAAPKDAPVFSIISSGLRYVKDSEDPYGVNTPSSTFPRRFFVMYVLPDPAPPPRIIALGFSP